MIFLPVIGLYTGINAFQQGGEGITIYPIFGFVTGILVGALGIGGGSILTPLLIMTLNITPIIAIGSALIHAFLMKTVGAMSHYEFGTIDLSITKKLLIGAIPASLLGAYFNSTLIGMNGQADFLIKYIISTVLIASGLLLLLQNRYRKNNRWNLSSHFQGRKMVLLIILIGVIAGFIMSLTSVGAGTLMMPLLILLLPITLRRIVGTTIFVSIFLTAIPGFTYLYFKFVDINLVGLLLLGSIPGVLVGAKLNNRASSRVLRLLLSPILIAIGLVLIIWR
ncbi:MAG: sulfite exporter TauE/SafE family protein [Candidatus Bathyarchaeia archaeon]